MPRRLPPLTSLRAFEAAGRHLSFTRAAAEMTVTQAAISHQVKALEEHLDVPLFHRMPRRLELTEAGVLLLPVVSAAFDSISTSVADLLEQSANTELTIRLAPSFAAKWLSPRLEAFRKLHPNIALSFTHSNSAVDFSRESISLAVTYGNGKWPNVESAAVLSLDFFPVCSPEFLVGEHPLTTPENLVHYTLLHDANYENWSAWISLAGLSDIDAKRGTIMDDTNVITRAAIDGLGVALGSNSFVQEHLESGKLVSPFGPELHDGNAYYVVCPPAHLERAEVRAFWDWLVDYSEVSKP